MPVEAAHCGSGMADNFFIQWTSSDLLNSGMYVAAGAESRYVGGNVNDSRSIWFIGAGWSNE